MDKKQTIETEENLMRLVGEYNQAVNTLNKYLGGYKNLAESDIDGFTVSGYRLRDFEKIVNIIKTNAEKVERTYGGYED